MVAMTDEPAVPEITDGRALTTDRDRRQIARKGDVTDSEHYQAVSRVRRRIRENLGDDVKLFEEHHAGLLEELRETVCKGESNDSNVEF